MGQKSGAWGSVYAYVSILEEQSTKITMNGYDIISFVPTFQESLSFEQIKKTTVATSRDNNQKVQ